MDRRSRATAAAAIFRLETIRAVSLGLIAALVAVALRLLMRSNFGGEQAIFSYPAIVIATLLFGSGAGSVTAGICFVALWYFVIPTRHSFEIASVTAAITLGVYVVAGTSLIWAIGAMRTALGRYRALAGELEVLVEQRTAERNRVWERSREFVAIVDGDDQLSSANPALCTLLGLNDATLRSRSFQSLLVEEDRQAYREARDRRDSVFEAKLLGLDGIVWVSWSMVHEADRFYLVGRDFTAEHTCGEMLQQSQKMEFVGQLAGGLAHDFGNLLPPISMTLHLLGRRHAEDDRTRELIEGAEESVDRAGQLIRRLLDLSRPSRLEPTLHAVEPLLQEIAPLIRQVIGSRDLRLSVDPELPGIKVDANQLDMALLNLALNAREATADDGMLDLRARTRRGQVEIILTDDGQGMDAETLARATEPFFSTRPSGEGSGLGLPMVHNFAVTAGGRLSIESDPGAGTRATISLPGASAE